MTRRYIVAGGRDFEDYALLESTLYHEILKHDWCHLVRDVTIVSGTARGADSLGERFAKENGIQVDRYPAQWKNPDGSTNRGAGPERNLTMALNADVLVAFWDGLSSGTRDMIHTALAHGLEVHVYRYAPQTQEEERF
jgi:hypothetical protein